MIPLQPRIRQERRRHAPKQAPCPHCGTLGSRKQILTRTVQSLAYQSIVLVQVTTAEYRAACSCCRTFRSQVEGIEPRAQYTNAVREAVLDRLLDDQMSLEGIQAALRRDFLLDLSMGFLYDCLRWKARQLDLAAYRQWVLEHFSGTVCVDEIHLGRYTLLLATDPLADMAIAFALVSRNDQEHMARFLGQLADHGLQPRVVVTDGSWLYPEVLRQLWPQAEHQLCVFHVLKDLNRIMLQAIKALRQKLRPRGRSLQGRRDARAARRRQQRQKATFVFRHRYLIFQRRQTLTAQQRRALTQVLEYLPELRLLRQFMDRIYRLVERAQAPAQAWQRWRSWRSEPAFAANRYLAKLQQDWTEEKFAKMVAFLQSPLGQRVRTNNHVERLNRKLRHYEKVRYRWRRARAIVRFMVVALDRLWQTRLRQTTPRPFRPGGGGRATHPTASAATGTPLSPPPIRLAG